MSALTGCCDGRWQFVIRTCIRPNIESMQRTYHVAEETLRSRASSSPFASLFLLVFVSVDFLDSNAFSFVLSFARSFGFLIDTVMLVLVVQGLYGMVIRKTLAMFVVYVPCILWFSTGVFALGRSERVYAGL